MRTLIPVVAIQILGAQTPGKLPIPIYPLSTAQIKPEDEMNLANLPPRPFKIGSNNFVLDRKGLITSQGPNGKKIRFQLRLPSGYYVEEIQCFENADLFFVLASISDWESGGAVIHAFSKSTGTSIWSMDFNSFNVGQSMVIGNAWYVSGIGAVGKLDLKTGRFQWIHKNLYNHKSRAFNSFGTPVLQSNRLIFTESVSSDSSRSSNPAKIVIDPSTGKILEKTDH